MNKACEMLATALRDAGLAAMSAAAGRGYYSDFQSPLDAPKMTLAQHLAQVGTPAAMAVRQRVIDGDFDDE